MKEQSGYIQYLLDQLAPIGKVTARPMFGGYGIYLNNLMFGIVEDDTFYLKVDNHNRPDYEALGLPPFTYMRKDKEVSLSYFLAPPEAIDDAEYLCDWARKSYDAAMRTAKGGASIKISSRQRR